MTQNNSEEPGCDLIKVLLAESVISQAQADLAVRDAENMSMGLDEVLLARRWVTEETLRRLAPWLFGGGGASGADSGAGGVGSGAGGSGAEGRSAGGTASGAGAGSGVGKTSGGAGGREPAEPLTRPAGKEAQSTEGADGLKELRGSSDDYGENLARYRSIVRQILGNDG